MKCPKCLETPERKDNPGDVVVKQTRKGRKRMFWGCSRYPDCTFATWNDPTKTPEELAQIKLAAKNKKLAEDDEPKVANEES